MMGARTYVNVEVDLDDFDTADLERELRDRKITQFDAPEYALDDLQSALSCLLAARPNVQEAIILLERVIRDTTPLRRPTR